MTTLLILTTISIFFSAWFLIRKPKTRSLEKKLTVIHFFSLLLFVIVFGLLFQNFRFTGRYTNTLIAIVFLITGIVLFGLTTSKIIRVYSGLIAIPALLIEISFLFGATPFALPAFVAFYMFAPPLKKEKVNNDYYFEVHSGGLMAPPNLFYLIERQGLFDKQFPMSSIAEHFKDISKVEVVNFSNEKVVVCKIYYDNTNEFTLDTMQHKK